MHTHTRGRFRNVFFGTGLHPESASLAILVLILFLLFVLLFMAFTAQPAWGQTFKVLYTFAGHQDGWIPYTGLSLDAAGNLYGTTIRGGGRGNCPGPGGCGSVFEVTDTGGGWAEIILHGFNGPYEGFALGPIGGTDGAYPYALTLGPDGSLYGTTQAGASGGGTVYRLTPSSGGWTETVLHRFLPGGSDGSAPQGQLVFDQAGSIYGTTVGGIAWGTVFRLTHSGGAWVESILYSFLGGSDGAWPYAGVIFDPAGNLYGTTGAGGADECKYGGPNCGTIYQLSSSGSGWTEKLLYNFHSGNDGGNPSPLVFDAAGNLYGTVCGGSGGGGAIFMLSPAGGNWAFRVLQQLAGTSCGFQGSLTLDAAGNLYGATLNGGAYGRGTIYRVGHSGNSWFYSDLYDFTGGSDGGEPNGSLIFDSHGNLYGTTQDGGIADYCGGKQYKGCGVVFEITP